MNSKLILHIFSNIVLLCTHQVTYNQQLIDNQNLFKKTFLNTLEVTQTKNVSQNLALEDQLPIVIVIYGHENSNTFMSRSIESAFEQQYENYRIIFLIDKNNAQALKQIESYQTQRLTTISYNELEGTLSGLYTALSSCDDQEIILLLNAHDWFAEKSTLTTICNAYLDNDIWFTYGSCKPDPKDVTIGIRTTAVPDEIRENRYFRDIFPFMPPLTFYAWLFKQINKEDFIDPQTGNFHENAFLCHIVWPLIEMAADHYEYIQQITYVVNNHDPLTKLEEDYYLRMACNAQMDKQLPIYQALEKPVFSLRSTKCTSKIRKFWEYVCSFVH